MKITIIAFIIAVISIAVSIYVSHRKNLEMRKQSIEENYPVNMPDFTPQEGTIQWNYYDGSTKQYLPVKKYKKVFDPSEEQMNELAKEKWRLITIDQGIAYFEREEMEWVESKGTIFQVQE